MMLMLATAAIMIAVGVAQYRNGLFSSFVVMMMVFISGLVAFGFFEPLADLLDPIFQNNLLSGSEDMIVHDSEEDETLSPIPEYDYEAPQIDLSRFAFVAKA